MGKVRDEAPAKTEKPAAKPSGSKGLGSRLAPFFANLVSGESYKPTQGRQARLWTGVGLGVLVAAGLYALYQNQLAEYERLTSMGIPIVLGAAFAWFIYRLVNFPPFADFLIATEAEMNKVSWTTRQDLIRATVVVLTTVLLLSIFLFGVDLIWSTLLRYLGVLRFEGFQASEG